MTGTAGPTAGLNTGGTVGTLPAGLLEAMDATRRSGRAPGLSLAVVDRDGVRFAAGCGSADLATGTPATPGTVYRWFSMTKIATATAVMQLVDRGALDLDAPATEYVPLLRRPAGPQPTVRQLLSHTSGLANPLPLRWVRPQDAPVPDPAAMLARVLRRRLIHRSGYRSAPGQQDRYSNVGYLALGQVIAAASGRTYQEFLRTELLEPLRAGRTGFAATPDGAADAAVGYVDLPRPADPLLRLALPAGVVGPRVSGLLSLRPFLVDGAAYGGLVGDVLDAARLLRLHLCDGEVDGIRLLAPGTAARMRQPAGPIATGTAGHGLGWWLAPEQAEPGYVEHLGGGLGFRNVLRLYPDLGLGVVVMSNGTRDQDLEPLMTLLTGPPAGRQAGADRPDGP